MLAAALLEPSADREVPGATRPPDDEDVDDAASAPPKPTGRLDCRSSWLSIGVDRSTSTAPATGGTCGRRHPPSASGAPKTWTSPTRELPSWCQAKTSPNRGRPSCVTTGQGGEEEVDDSGEDVDDVPVPALKLLVPLVFHCPWRRDRMWAQVDVPHQGTPTRGRDVPKWKHVFNWGAA